MEKKKSLARIGDEHIARLALDNTQGNLATDGLQIPAVTMTNVPLKPVE